MSKLKGGMGAAAEAILEMFKQSGMPETEVQTIYWQMNQYFGRPSNQTCNSILLELEKRLVEEKARNGVWYGEIG